MHDAALADTTVIDDPDDPPVVVRPRTSTGDLTVQVRVRGAGPWHRKAIVSGLTACGVDLRPRSAMGLDGLHRMRKETYEGELCPRCFTAFELNESAEANRKLAWEQSLGPQGDE